MCKNDWNNCEYYKEIDKKLKSHKKILITGHNSYIGVSFEKWCSSFGDEYNIESIDMKNDNWKNYSFRDFDVVLHVSGIVHSKETKKNEKLFYEVNKELSEKTAIKAKKEGVKQFIFLSSMSVYGIEEGEIDLSTEPHPTSSYGKSKFEAEKHIQALSCDSFEVAILRPPMVYGKGCKGNYPLLAKFIKLSPVFPLVDNLRSMIYIDNLCEFIRLLVNTGNGGLYFPQNKEYVCISDMAKEISKAHKKKIIFIKWLTPLMKITHYKSINTRFANLTYNMSISEADFKYCIVDFKTSIKMTEKGG